MFEKIRIISEKTKNLDNYFNLKDIFGKKIITIKGEFFGKVKDLVAEKDKILGVIVKTKSREIFIDFCYINDLYSKSLMLKISPAFRVIGMKVYDSVGKKLGKVVDIEQINETTNEIDKIIVKKNFFNKALTIKYSAVKSDVKNILLNKRIE